MMDLSTGAVGTRRNTPSRLCREVRPGETAWGEVTLLPRLRGLSQGQEEAQSVPGRRTNLHKGKRCEAV